MTQRSIYVLDDDPVFLSAFCDELKAQLSDMPFACTVTSFTETDAFTQAVKAAEPDLIFADIQLEKEKPNGIEYMRFLRENGCGAEIVFLTGYLNYATDIFGVNPIYFILKSEYERRIGEALDCFIKRRRFKAAGIEINGGKETEVLPLDSIMYLERNMRKTHVHCPNREISLREPLDEILARLPDDRFVLCHQSIIVNLSFVNGYNRFSVTLTNGENLPVSRSRAEAFHKAMTAYLRP